MLLHNNWQKVIRRGMADHSKRCNLRHQNSDLTVTGTMPYFETSPYEANQFVTSTEPSGLLCISPIGSLFTRSCKIQRYFLPMLLSHPGPHLKEYIVSRTLNVSLYLAKRHQPHGPPPQRDLPKSNVLCRKGTKKYQAVSQHFG